LCAFPDCFSGANFRPIRIDYDAERLIYRVRPFFTVNGIEKAVDDFRVPVLEILIYRLTDYGC
jgi:hypothetical protein